jgi:hypothetical protein
MSFAFVLTSIACSSTLAQGSIKAGTYVADLPTASGCGRRILLELFAGDSYLFVQRYLCKPWTLAQLETGSWMTGGEELVLSSTSGEMRFSAGAAGLEYIGSRYGQAGLTLGRLE